MIGDYHNSVQISDCAEKETSVSATGKGKGKGKGVGLTCGESDESFFSLPSCQITVSVQRLVQMAHHTLGEACLAQSSCVDILLHTARDVLNLFRALVPTIHADALANDPRMAALFHNDCIYIAHHMLTIGHHYRDRSLLLKCCLFSTDLSCRLPKSDLVNDKQSTFIGMIDLVPSFRQLGSRVLFAQVSRQKSKLSIALAQMPSYNSEVDEQSFVKIESFLKKILFEFTQLGSLWRNVLPTSLYHGILGELVDIILLLMIQRVQSLKHIATETSHRLYHLHVLMLKTSELFDGDSTAVKYAKYWTAFAELTETLVGCSSNHTFDPSSHRIGDGDLTDPVFHEVVRTLVLGDQ